MSKKTEKAITPASKANNSQYIIAVVLMVFIGALIVIFRPDADIIDVFGVIAPTTAAMLAFMKSQETHLAVNSRLDAFIENAGLAERAKGVEEGREKAEARTDALKKTDK